MLRFCGQLLSILILCSVSIAESRIDIYGTSDCSECIKTKEIIIQSGMKYRTFNLLDRSVEQKYLKKFGRGKIPVVQIGDEVIRGYSPEKIKLALKQLTKNLQRCANGMVLEDYFSSYRGGSLAGRDKIDVVLDKCYGAKGWIECGDESLPFRKLSETQGGYVVLPTHSDSTINRDRSCVVKRY